MCVCVCVKSPWNSVSFSWGGAGEHCCTGSSVLLYGLSLVVVSGGLLFVVVHRL